MITKEQQSELDAIREKNREIYRGSAGQRRSKWTQLFSEWLEKKREREAAKHFVPPPKSPYYSDNSESAFLVLIKVGFALMYLVIFGALFIWAARYLGLF